MSFLTFGEIMLRLTPVEKLAKIAGSTGFAVNYAGSESNVAASLAILGDDVQFVTKLPDNALGDSAIRSLKGHGIGTRWIKRGGDRLGTYFIESGSSIRPSRVIYDRKHSSFSEMDPGEFDWTTILAGKSWIFVSGITAALSGHCAGSLIALVNEAKKMKVKVAFDFNYRRTLWDDPLQARKLFDEVLENTDLLFGNIGSLSDVYGMEFKGANETELTCHGLEMASKEFGLKQAAFTIREHSSASKNELSAAFFDKGKMVVSASYSVEIADRFGTGDAFAAGLLHALEREWDSETAIEFAAAAFALKHTINGDHHLSREQEILSIMEGNTSGHVIR